MHPPYCIRLVQFFFFRNQLRKYSPHQRIAGWVASWITSGLTSQSSTLFNHFFHRMVYFLFSIRVLYHKLSALNKAFDGVCGVVKKFLIKVGKDAYFFFNFLVNVFVALSMNNALLNDRLVFRVNRLHEFL